MHDTPVAVPAECASSPPSAIPSGTPGSLLVIQRLPFQLSATGWANGIPDPGGPSMYVLATPPTAVHQLAVTQEIAVSQVAYFPGEEAARSLQLVPFHVSASAYCRERPAPRAPTATHEVLEVQDTPDSSVCATPPAGVACTVQVVPFHASTRASPGLEL